MDRFRKIIWCLLVWLFASQVYGAAIVTLEEEYTAGDYRLEWPAEQAEWPNNAANTGDNVLLLEKIDANNFLLGFHEQSGEYGGNGEFFTLKLFVVKVSDDTPSDITYLSSATIGCDGSDCSRASMPGEADFTMIDDSHFALVYSEPGLGQGRLQPGNRYDVLRIGSIGVDGTITLGDRIYYNGLNCDDDAPGVPGPTDTRASTHQVCRADAQEEDSCGEHEEDVCAPMYGGGKNNVVNMGNNHIVITYRDYNDGVDQIWTPIHASRTNAAYAAEVDVDNLTATLGQRVDTRVNGQPFWASAGRRPGRTNTIKVGSNFIHFWSIEDQSRHVGWSMPGAISEATDSVLYGSYATYQESGDCMHASNPVAIDIGSNTFAFFYYQHEYVDYTMHTISKGAYWRLGTITGTGASAVVTYTRQNSAGEMIWTDVSPTASTGTFAQIGYRPGKDSPLKAQFRLVRVSLSGPTLAVLADKTFGIDAPPRHWVQNYPSVLWLTAQKYILAYAKGTRPIVRVARITGL